MKSFLLAAMLVMLAVSGYSATLCNYPGPYYSPDIIQLWNFTVTGPNNPPEIGDTLSINYVVRNFGQEDVTLDNPGGLYLRVQEGSGNPYDYGNTNQGGTLIFGKYYSFSRTKSVDEEGTLNLWPSYKAYQQSYNWKLCNLSVQGQQDQTPPDVSVVPSPSSPTTSEQVSFTATATDSSGIAKIEIYIDGNSLKTCYASPCEYVGGPYPAGSILYKAFAEDNNANSAFSEEKQLTITEEQQQQDQSPPEMSLSVMPLYPNISSLVYFLVSASDPSGIDKITISIDKVKVEECSKSPCSYTGGPYPEGYIYVEAGANDTFGNLKTESRSVYIEGLANETQEEENDGQAPSFTIKGGKYILPGQGRYFNVSVEAEDDSGISKIEIWVNGSKARECTGVAKCSYSDSSITAPVDYTVKAFDSFGNLREEGDSSEVFEEVSGTSWFFEDFDNDTIENIDDNCVFISNENQSDCDSDGVGDVCDLCPGTYHGYGVVNTYGCGCWDLDADEESYYYVNSTTLVQEPEDLTSMMAYGSVMDRISDMPVEAGDARLEYAGDMIADTGAFDYSGIIYVESFFGSDEGIDVITTVRAEISPFICESMPYTEYRDECDSDPYKPTLKEYSCDRFRNLTYTLHNCSHRCMDGKCICKDTDNYRNYFERGRPDCFGYSECPDREDTTDVCLNTVTLDEFFPIIEDNGCRFLAEHKPCTYGCRHGICVTETFANTRNTSMYSGRPIFVTSDHDWKNVLRLVPATVWDDEDGDLHTYPFLIYHREVGAGFDRYDSYSLIHFIQQYAPTKVKIFEDYSGAGIPGRLDDSLVLDNTVSQERIQSDPQRYSGAGLDLDQIEVLSHSNSYMGRDIAHLFWDEVNTIVIGDDDDYETSLIAAVWASRLNAPLYFKSEMNSISEYQHTLGMHVYLIGDFSTSYLSDIRGYADAIHYTKEAAQLYYKQNTSTDKVIFVNARDINTAKQRIGDARFENRLHKDSLAAPYLAAAKHELILTTDRPGTSEGTDCSGSTATEDLIEDIDDDIDADIGRLWPGDDKPNYLTLIGSPIVIPDSYYDGCYEGWAQFRRAVDWKYGSLSDSHGSIDMHVGRIYGYTVTDTSAYVARDVFYEEMYDDHYDSTEPKGLSIGHSFTECADGAKRVRDEMNSDYRSFCFTEGSRTNCVTNTTAPAHYYYDAAYVTFCDHGYWFAWSDTIDVNGLPKLDFPYVFGAACATSNVYQGEENTFSIRMIRRGAMGYHGAISVSYSIGDSWQRSIRDFADGSGTTMGEYTSERIHSNTNFRKYYTLIGDPTIVPIFEVVPWS